MKHREHKIVSTIAYKFCPTCKEWKLLETFSRHKGRWDGLYGQCKSCVRDHHQKTKTAMAITNSQYRQNNKDAVAANKARYYQEHKESIERRHAQYQKRRLQNDIGFRLARNLRIRVSKAISGQAKSARTLELLGCSVENLKIHLEKQFVDNMSWDNYGKWHIDHIKPCALFDMTKEEEQQACFHYTNLQPLWAKENISKGKKYPVPL